MLGSPENDQGSRETLVDRFWGWLDPEAKVEQVSDVEQFELLSRRNHSSVVDAQLIAEETEPSVFKLHTSYASWRGDQAGKVIVEELYGEGYRGNLEDNAWETFRLKMALAAEKRLREISGLLPKANIRTHLLLNRLDGSRVSRDIDPAQRNALYDEAMRRGLSPLTPVQPASSTA